MGKRKVVVAGALGVIGRAAVEHFCARGDGVVGLSRRLPDFESEAQFVSVDLHAVLHLQVVFHPGVIAQQESDPVIIISGTVDVDPEQREAALAGFTAVVVVDAADPLATELGLL